MYMYSLYLSIDLLITNKKNFSFLTPDFVLSVIIINTHLTCMVSHCYNNKHTPHMYLYLIVFHNFKSHRHLLSSSPRSTRFIRNKKNKQSWTIPRSEDQSRQSPNTPVSLDQVSECREKFPRPRCPDRARPLFI
jgi:hypothetical protein